MLTGDSISVDYLASHQGEIGNIRCAHGGCEHCMLGKITKERFNGRTLGAAFFCAVIYDVLHVYLCYAMCSNIYFHLPSF